MAKSQTSQAVFPSVIAAGNVSLERILLLLAGLAVLLRIIIWKFFPPCEVFVKEDLSNILVAGLILLLAIAWLILKIVRREGIRQNGFEIPILLFLGAATASLFYTVDFSASLTGVLVLFAQIAFFFMLQDLLDSHRRIQVFLYFLICCAVLVALYGIKDFIFLSWRPSLPTDIEIARTKESLYYILTNRRVTSFLGWPNTLAGYLALFMPLSLVFAQTAKSKNFKVLFRIAFLVLVITFVFTFSFLGWSSFILGTLALFFLSSKFLKIRDWPTGTRIAAAIACVVFLILFGWVILRKDFAGAMVPRVEYYKGAVALVKAKPVLGHGWDTYQFASRRYAESSAAITAYAHNSYLQVWAETGLVGLLGLIFLFWLFVRRAFVIIRGSEMGEQSLLFWAVVWGLGVFFIDNVFSFTILKPNVALHFWVMLAVFVALCRENRASRQTSGVRWPFVASSLILLTVFCFLCRMILGFFSYQAGREAFLQGDLGNAERNFHRAQAWDPWRSRFYTALGEIYLKAYFQTGEAKYFDRAEVEYWQAAKRSPSSYGNYFILSKLYARHGDKTKAEQLAQVAKVLSPYQYEYDLKVLAEMAERRKTNRGGGP